MSAVERIRSVEERLASEARLRVFVENAPVALAMFDRDLCFLAVNRQYIETFNAPHDLIGRCAYDVFPEVPERWKRLHQRALAGESVSADEDLFLRSDLRAQWVKWKIDPWFEMDGSVGGILLAAEDITERVEARGRLREKEEQLALVMEAANIGTWDWDLENNKIRSSERWYRIFGIPPGTDINYERRLDAIHPDDRKRVDRVLKDAVKAGKPYEIEFRVLWPDGSVHWIASRGKVFYDDVGQPVRMRGAAIDVTRLKETEEDLEQSRAEAKAQADELQAILDAVPALTFIAQDRKCERMFSSRFGHDALRVPYGGNPSQSVPPETRPPFTVYAGQRQLEPEELPMQQAAATGEAVRNQELRIKFPDETFIDIFGHAVPLLDDLGTPRGAVGAFIDISERKRAEELLHARTAELESLVSGRNAAQEALREQRERAEFVAEASDVGFWFCDLPFDKLIWDKRVKAHFWLPENADVTIHTFYDRLHPEDRERTRQAIEESIGRRGQYDIEYRTMSDDGQHKWIRAIGRTFYDERNVPRRFDGVTMDVTERRKIDSALRASEAKYRELADSLERQVQARTLELQQRNEEALRASQGLRELSRRVLRVRDEERRRLARELHDSAGQLLTALGLELSSLELEAPDADARVRRQIESSKDLVQQVQREIRTTSYLLHPPLLDEAGLASALGWYIQGLNERSALRTELDISPDFGRIPRDQELVVFRLVQESLTNVYRHSSSKTASVRVARDPAAVVVEIRDQGKGMSSEKLLEIRRGGSGVGVQGMRERLRQYGGQLVIESNDTGTRVYASIPVSDLEPENEIAFQPPEPAV